MKITKNLGIQWSNVNLSYAIFHCFKGSEMHEIQIVLESEIHAMEGYNSQGYSTENPEEDRDRDKADHRKSSLQTSALKSHYPV